MTKHTPRPWSAASTIVFGSDGGARMTVADTRCAGSLTRDEDEANARLISAAPDMLAALENLLIGCPDETFHTGHRLRISELERLNGTIVMAKAAIAKARGDEETARLRLIRDCHDTSDVII